MIRYERVEPRAAMLIESMRDLGYSLKTALADIIDNSITANARSIEIFANTSSSNCQLAVIDDGCGMEEREILAAMRPGSQSPARMRKSNDLGRFGLGLKTASFSQCRRLTVVSRKDGRTSCATWDLDDVVKTDDWLVEISDQISNIPWLQHLGDHGTLILWEKLDRLVGSNSIENQKQIVHQIDEAAEHLELVFHRYLEGEKGIKKVNLYLNDRQLAAFDPFHSKHAATQIQPLEPEPLMVNGHLITIQGFTLPHHRKVSPADWERYAGREGYVRNQGFYVYRGKRLIIYGTWFGLARQNELTKLTRVRVDIPNDLDADWKIDVKKASAQPPAIVRSRLRRIIETIGANSKRVYTARGRKLVSDSRLPVWTRLQDKNEISYCLNRDHPVFSDFAKRLPSEMCTEFSKILELASSAIPIDSLFADVSGNPDQVSNIKMSSDSLKAIVETTFNTLTTGGLKASEIRDMLSVTEPFRSRWQETKAQLDTLDKGGKTDE
jgi:hypothetical protein